MDLKMAVLVPWQADDAEAALEALKPAWEALQAGKHKKLNALDCSLVVSFELSPEACRASGCGNIRGHLGGGLCAGGERR